MKVNNVQAVFNFIQNHCGNNGWYVIGKTLQSIVKTGSIGNSPFEIVVDGDASRVLNEFGKNVSITKGKIKETQLKEFVKDCRMIKCNIPKNLGAVLDEWNSDWAAKKSTRGYNDAISFFTTKRRKEAHEEIALMLDCGEKAGIRDKMFLGFGGVLGYAWMSDFMPNDDDIDICFLPIEQEQKEEYLRLCKEVGLCECRMVGPASLNNEWVWFSIGRRSSSNGIGVKACHWFWFEHNGYWWHSKGDNWTSKKDKYRGCATSKGIPSSIFTGRLREVEFGGNRINVPENVGKCLDWWYPEWIFRKQVCSAPTAILITPNQKNKKTWFIERNNE